MTITAKYEDGVFKPLEDVSIRLIKLIMAGID